MPPKKRYPTVSAPADEKWPPPLTSIHDGPPVGTLARCVWLEQETRELLDAMKADLVEKNNDQGLVRATWYLGLLVGDLVQARKAAKS